jgi:DNA-binding Lrp family transcriptional regulator
MDEYARFITEKISAIENINSIDVSFVLDEVKRQTAYVIN